LGSADDCVRGIAGGNSHSNERATWM